MLFPRLIVFFILIAGPAFVLTQSTVPLQSTAGVPASQNVGDGGTSTNFADGLGGTSTGTSIGFQAGSTAGAPSSTVMSQTLTGQAASDASASIASKASQGSGSMFGYTSTTGSLISGITNSLGVGYNTGASTLGPAQSGTGSNGSTSFYLSGQSLVAWVVAAAFSLIGAVIVL